MPQTRFVLKKALEFGHAVVVVVNKIDRPSARPDYVINSTFELFIELNASDEQVYLWQIFISLVNISIKCMQIRKTIYHFINTFLSLDV